MTPFGFPEEPARGRRYDELPFPVDSPSAGIDYSDAAGLIVAPDRTTPPEVVRVTSATATSGLYPARRELWSDAAAPPRLSDRSTAQDCWAQGPNGEALTATRYDALFLGYHADGLPVYSAADLGTGGAAGGNVINVKETNEGTGTGTTLFTNVGEFGTDLGEIADLGGSPRAIRQGFCGMQLAFDSALGDAMQSIPVSSDVAPVTVTFPAFGTGHVAANFRSAEFAATGLNNVIQCTRNGIYLLCAAAHWDANATGFRYAAVVDSSSGNVVSGIKDLRNASGGTKPTVQSLAGPSFLGSGNYQFSLVVAHNAGSAINLLSAWLSAVKIG
jgi:hypothetical protein